KSWSGVLLLIEKNEHSGEKDYRLNLRKEWGATLFSWGLLLFPFLLGILAVTYNALLELPMYNTWGFSLSIVLKSVGVVVAVLLLWHEVDKSNPLLQRICSGGKKVNCDAVLSSKASQVFSWLSWSEVGFFYFAGGFLALLFSGSQALPVLTILVCMNILALPYTIFSIFYQWRVSKQWCMLCLSVQVLLVAEFLVSLLSGRLETLQFIPDFFALLIPSFLIPLVPAFVLPVAVWYIVKPHLLAAQQGKRDFRQLQRIKYNSEIFETLLQKQKQITVDTTGLGITLGNPQAKMHIIKVCNPYCGPCAQAHKLLDELMETNQVRVQVIFTATNEEKDFRAVPAKHLLAIAERGDEHLTQKALTDWYEAKEKNYEEFAAKYPVSQEDLDRQRSKIEAMNTWCDETKIEYTPTIFVNGHQLPFAYWVDDLKYFLED
ncbi:MAG: thioredoxin domain-containing protein, partial [Bacteroidales bacterium]|nr:thioredoxin domain-containing protein [Bacteroidales bacterium]